MHPPTKTTTKSWKSHLGGCWMLHQTTVGHFCPQMDRHIAKTCWARNVQGCTPWWANIRDLWWAKFVYHDYHGVFLCMLAIPKDSNRNYDELLPPLRIHKSRYILRAKEPIGWNHRENRENHLAIKWVEAVHQIHPRGWNLELSQTGDKKTYNWQVFLAERVSKTS